MSSSISLFFTVIHTICFLIGCFLNGFLSYLAIFHSPPIIKTYSLIVLNVALTNIGACICDFLLQQRMIPSGFRLFYISYGPCVKSGPEMCFDVYSIMLHFYSHSLWLLFFAFVYRYYVMLRKEPSRYYLQFFILLIYIPSLIMMVSLILDHSDPESIRKQLKLQFPTYDLSGLTISGSLDTVRFAPMFAIIHMTVLSTPIFIGILVFRRKIIAHLTYKGVDLTKKTRNLHAQLLRALTLQAIIPIFYLLGVSCYFISQFGLWSHPIIEFSIFTCFLMVPILTPLSSLIYVTPYKRHVAKILQDLKLLEEDATRKKLNTNSLMTVGV